MTLKVVCDGCGREVDSREVKVRVFWKRKIMRETATGRITEKWVVVRGDFCSYECFLEYLASVMAEEVEPLKALKVEVTA